MTFEATLVLHRTGMEPPTRERFLVERFFGSTLKNGVRSVRRFNINELCTIKSVRMALGTGIPNTFLTLSSYLDSFCKFLALDHLRHS